MNVNRPILQAPWRTRQQKIGAVLLAIVGTSMIAALYLGLASQATLAGREIQTLERKTSLVKEENANLKTELARILSHKATEIRGDSLGFYPASSKETHYIYVPGYEGQQTINLTNDANRTENKSSLPVEYTLSLFEWIEWQTNRGVSR